MPSEVRQKKILIIDDDSKFLHIFYRALKEKGHCVVMASETESATEWALHKDLLPIDMIISDQRMPGEEGTAFLSFLGEVRKADPARLALQSELYQRIRKRFSRFSDAEFLELAKNLGTRSSLRVILSGYGKDDDIDKALETGTIDEFISKETPMPELLDRIDNLLKAELGSIPSP